jgi:hypothetical protein
LGKEEGVVERERSEEEGEEEGVDEEEETVEEGGEVEEATLSLSPFPTTSPPHTHISTTISFSTSPSCVGRKERRRGSVARGRRRPWEGRAGKEGERRKRKVRGREAEGLWRVSAVVFWLLRKHEPKWMDALSMIR